MIFDNPFKNKRNAVNIFLIFIISMIIPFIYNNLGVLLIQLMLMTFFLIDMFIVNRIARFVTIAIFVILQVLNYIYLC